MTSSRDNSTNGVLIPQQNLSNPRLNFRGGRERPTNFDATSRVIQLAEFTF